MTPDERGTTKARRMLMAGLATGLPLLMAPESALAATVGGVAVAATASGIAGAALGALAVGGVGHILHKRERRELERVVARLSRDGASMAVQGSESVAAEPESETVDAEAAAPEPVSFATASVIDFVVPSIDASAEGPKLELIDALPQEPLQVVEPAEPAEPVDSREPAEPAAEEAAPDPKAAKRDWSSLPDPFDDAQAPSPAGQYAAYGASMVASAPLSTDPSTAMSASKAMDVPTAAAMAEPVSRSPMGQYAVRNVSAAPDPSLAADRSVVTGASRAMDVPEPAAPESIAASGAVPYVPAAQNPYLRSSKKGRRRSRKAAAAALASDYESVASEYVERKSFRERMSLTARGVAAVLGERMERNMMDGLPVIERADGSVSDLGTSWWQPVQRSQRSIRDRVPSVFDAAPAAQSPSSTGFAPAAPVVPATPVESAAPAVPIVPVLSDSSVQPVAPVVTVTPAVPVTPVAPAVPIVPPVPAASVAPPIPAVPATRAVDADERRRRIVSRVATVEEEAYPEIDRTWQEPDEEWENALAALDDRVEDNLMAGREERLRRRQDRLAASVIRPRDVAAPSVPDAPRAFGDAVGSVDTIDEPDGLERDTQFLFFRAPGNHPEVQDTGSYINYLIGDEFKRNPSSQARRQARSFLRVHDGGQNTRAQAM